MPLWVYDETGKLVTSQGAFEFTLTADSGSNQTVNNGETVDIAGGVGIATTASTTNTVTIDSVWDYEEILGSSGSFDVDLTTDVATWDSNVKSMIIEVGLRSTVASTQDVVYLFFNNDTTASNYFRQYLNSNDGAVAGVEDATPSIGNCPASTSPSSSFMMGEIKISMPNSTNYRKVARLELTGNLGTATLRNDRGGMVWEASTSAITRIQIRTDNNPTDLFATNSFIRIRLIK